MNDNSYFLKSYDGLQLVRQQHYAFHCEANTAFPIIRSMFTPREICQLNVLPFRRDKMQAFVIRKMSPFHDIFAIKWVFNVKFYQKSLMRVSFNSYRLFWMRETGMDPQLWFSFICNSFILSGIISKHQRHWMAPKPPCLSNAIFSSIGFSSTIAAVEFLILGYSLAIIILLFEIIWHSYVNKNRLLIFS